MTDTLESLHFSVNATLKELGLGQIDHIQCKAFVGNGARYLLECSLKAAGDPELIKIEEAMEVYGRIFKTGCTYKVAPYEGIVEMLKKLQSQGVLLAVLSNKPHEQTCEVVKTFFGTDTFQWVQGQQEGIPRKPNPDAAIYIAEKFGITPEECVYIGDSDVDMQTGNAAKMLTVGVTWGFREKSILLEHGADYTIDKAEELITIVGKKE